MSHQENRISDSHFSKWVEGSAPPEDALEIARLSATRTLAMDEAGAAIARQLNGPLTALLLYMGEIKQLAENHDGSAAAPSRKGVYKTRAGQPGDGVRTPGVMFASNSGQKPLTKREREVLNLISEGCSNKQGA